MFNSQLIKFNDNDLEIENYFELHSENLFSSINWLKIISNTYNLDMFLLKIFSKDIQETIIPLAKIRNKYITLPFIDYSVLVNAGKSASKYLNELVRYFNENKMLFKQNVEDQKMLNKKIIILENNLEQKQKENNKLSL